MINIFLTHWFFSVYSVFHLSSRIWLQMLITHYLPPVDGFCTAKDRERGVMHVEKIITDEKGVANFYDKTTATFCMPLALTLALHPKTLTADWTGLLVWMQSVSSSGYAIVDKELWIF